MKEKRHLNATTVQKDGKLLGVASTETEDRVGDSLRMSDWDLKSFKKNPVLQAGHDHKPQFTIGIAKNIKIENNQLVFEPHFHTVTQLARDIGAMYEAEPAILKAWSVGFIPYALLKGEDGKPMGKNELLEISAVAVPANAECLTEAKGYGDSESKEVSDWVEKAIEVKKKEVEEEIKTEEKEIDYKYKLLDSSKTKENDVYKMLYKVETAYGELEVMFNIEEKVFSDDKLDGAQFVCNLKEDAIKNAIKDKVLAEKDITENNNDIVVEEEVKEEEKEEEKAVKDVEVETKESDDAETVSEQLDENEARRQKYQRLGMVDEAVYAFYNVYLNKDIGVNEFNKLLKELAGILVKLADGKKDFDKGSFKDVKEMKISFSELFEVKEGKVLSKKNREMINGSVSQLKDTIVALEKLLKVTESAPQGEEEKAIEAPEKAKGNDEIQGRDPKVVKESESVSADKIVLHALQKIAANANKALHAKKSKNK